MSANSSQPTAARRMTLMSNAPRFALGQMVATPGALALLEQTGFSALALISRHVHGDWGDCCVEDKA
ncbi:type I restriction endonuclease subunit M, partial [Comamonas aquatica]|nr:type I restriction endonuclease subunit M [Comamonas aquatica]MDH1619519.1 type I restriction endonuclease subunit M [Comamonas aquatica]MDH2007493.1 type I restriction endonuclease subunit M [Comamonas aquatica]